MEVRRSAPRTPLAESRTSQSPGLVLWKVFGIDRSGSARQFISGSQSNQWSQSERAHLPPESGPVWSRSAQRWSLPPRLRRQLARSLVSLSATTMSLSSLFSSVFSVVHADAPEEKEVTESAQEEAQEEPQEEEEEEEPEDVRALSFLARARARGCWGLGVLTLFLRFRSSPRSRTSARSRPSARPTRSTSRTARRRSTPVRATRARTALRNCEFPSSTYTLIHVIDALYAAVSSACVLHIARNTDLLAPARVSSLSDQ